MAIARPRILATALADRDGQLSASEGARPIRFWSILASIACEHRVLFMVVSAYVTFGGLVLIGLGRRWPLALTNRWFAAAWVGVSTAWLLARGVRSWRRVEDALKPVRVGGALVVLLLVVPFQTTFQSLKQSIAPTVGFPLDSALARADELLHAGPAWRMFSVLLRSPAAIRSIDWLYMFWFPGVVIVTVWLSWTSRRMLRARALIALLLIWIVGGTVGAWALASSGPCYSQAPQYQELIKLLDGLGFPLWARFNQRAIWDAQLADQWLPFGGISAMPSMHVAVAVWMAILVWHRSRPLGVLLIAYAVIIQIGSVVLGWHYAIDGYVAAALAWASWSASGRLVRS